VTVIRFSFGLAKIATSQMPICLFAKAQSSQNTDKMLTCHTFSGYFLRSAKVSHAVKNSSQCFEP